MTGRAHGDETMGLKWKSLYSFYFCVCRFVNQLHLDWTTMNTKSIKVDPNLSQKPYGFIRSRQENPLHLLHMPLIQNLLDGEEFDEEVAYRTTPERARHAGLAGGVAGEGGA